MCIPTLACEFVCIASAHLGDAGVIVSIRQTGHPRLHRGGHVESVFRIVTPAQQVLRCVWVRGSGESSARVCGATGK